jgi:hypothetical protein
MVRGPPREEPSRVQQTLTQLYPSPTTSSPHDMLPTGWRVMMDHESKKQFFMHPSSGRVVFSRQEIYKTPPPPVEVALPPTGTQPDYHQPSVVTPDGVQSLAMTLTRTPSSFTEGLTQATALELSDSGDESNVSEPGETKLPSVELVDPEPEDEDSYTSDDLEDQDQIDQIEEYTETARLTQAAQCGQPSSDEEGKWSGEEDEDDDSKSTASKCLLE